MGRLPKRTAIKAWQAINRATPTGTSVGVDVAPGDAVELRLVDAEQGRTAATETRPATAWTKPAAAPADNMAEVSAALLSGASRVLMAARLADAPDHVRIHLVIQAVELAAQITRTIAAQRDATAAQHRAA